VPQGVARRCRGDRAGVRALARFRAGWRPRGPIRSLPWHHEGAQVIRCRHSLTRHYRCTSCSRATTCRGPPLRLAPLSAGSARSRNIASRVGQDAKIGVGGQHRPRKHGAEALEPVVCGLRRCFLAVADDATALAPNLSSGLSPNTSLAPGAMGSR
jgi:hypothetical protein